MKVENKIVEKNKLINELKDYYKQTIKCSFIAYFYEKVVVGEINNFKDLENLINDYEDIQYLKIFDEENQFDFVDYKGNFKVKHLIKENDETMEEIYLIWHGKDMENRGFKIGLFNIDKKPIKYTVEHFIDYDENGIFYVKDSKIKNFIFE